MTARQLADAGVGSWVLTRAVRAGTVVRAARGVYGTVAMPAWPRFVVTEKGVDPAHVLQVRAVLLSLGSSATAVGRTAAALRGWGLLVEPARTVEVALPHSHGHTAVRRVRVSRRRRLARELWSAAEGADPVWVSTAVQTVVDLSLSLPLLEAVVVCDSALRSGQVVLERLREQVGRLGGRRDAARLVAVLDLCDPDSGSVLESVLRVRMVQAGLSGFTTQRLLVPGDGGAPLRVDFCFEAERLVVEADGARWHQDTERDRGRDNAAAVLGWRVLRLTWAEVVHDWPGVLRQLRAALAPDCTHLPDSSRAVA